MDIIKTEQTRQKRKKKFKRTDEHGRIFYRKQRRDKGFKRHAYIQKYAICPCCYDAHRLATRVLFCLRQHEATLRIKSKWCTRPTTQVLIGKSILEMYGYIRENWEEIVSEIQQSQVRVEKILGELKEFHAKERIYDDDKECKQKIATPTPAPKRKYQTYEPHDLSTVCPCCHKVHQKELPARLCRGLYEMQFIEQPSEALRKKLMHMKTYLIRRWGGA